MSNAQVSDDRAIFYDLKTLQEKTRSDAVVFAVLTIVLTPIFLAAVVIAFVFALAFVDLPVIDHLGFQRSFLTGVNLTVVFMMSSYFLRPKPRWQRHGSDTAWIVSALSLCCVLVALSYATRLVTTHAMLFWSMYLFLFLAMMACMGQAYEPHDDYYLGWTEGPLLFDDPFTLRDDVDRAHLTLGFLAATSALILDSYASIFGSRWLWNGLEDHEIREAVALLKAIASDDTDGVKSRLRAFSGNSASDIVRALVKLELITIDRGHVRLSLKGREFLSRSAYSGSRRLLPEN